MEAPQLNSAYSAEDFETLGFHDCYVHGLRWESATYALILDLDYIVEWSEHDGSYKFWVVPATLHFEYSSDVKMSLDWTHFAMECQIQDLHRRERKATPNGNEIFRWEIEFARPCGSVELWAADFELRIQEKPRLVETQRLRGGGVAQP